MENMKKEIGRRLRICRMEKNLTQERLSEQVGLETQSYANIEYGAKLFSVEVLMNLAKVLDTSADYILTGRHNAKTPVTDILNALDAENAARLEDIVRLFYDAVAGRAATSQEE